MKKFYDKACIMARRICTTNVFGMVANVLLFGGTLLTCAGVIPAGVTCLTFAGLGYFLSVGKVVLEDREVQQCDKFFGDEEIEVEDYQSEKVNETVNISTTTQESVKTKEQDLQR